jgi:dGTPase
MSLAVSRGRRYAEPPHPYRNDYQRDRDRIIHARAFRRLEAKTQVFTRRYSDHFRNRLTHTLEVTQISRTVAGALGLNSDLVEALALVHDIGHAPFGHAGEQRLDEIMGRFHDRFDHNLHALRIVENFEQRYAGFPGLNLTFEVREGIIKHSRDYDPKEFPALAEYALDERPPLEAQLIDLCDEIAYSTADLDDGYEAKLLPLETILGNCSLFQSFYERADQQYARAPIKLRFNEALRLTINALVTDLIQNTARQVTEAGVKTVEDVRRASHRLVGFSEAVARQNAGFKKYLYANLYLHEQLVEERAGAGDALEQLFDHYIAHPDHMPRTHFEKTRQEPLHRVVCDYLAGMTDHYLLRQHRLSAAKTRGSE